jgi:MoxR-like ATPase
MSPQRARSFFADHQRPLLEAPSLPDARLCERGRAAACEARQPASRTPLPQRVRLAYHPSPPKLARSFASRGALRQPMQFQGTKTYIATDDLKVAVNAAITLQRPLLIKGEPGTGKTVLAIEVAKAIKAPLIEWHIKSTTKALQGLYEYDAVSRLRDSQLGDPRVADIRNYIRKGKLWEAFTMGERPVLLIDEIDKADIEFPNDLLQELDRMEFYVYETHETIQAKHRPIVIITSNNEKELPDAFLRRCFFHYIKFPDPDTMRAIVDVHFPDIKGRLVSEALKVFYDVREVPGIKKKPSTSELLDWIKLLLNEDISPETLRENDPRKLIPPLHGALLKNEQDVHLFERLAFIARRQNQG